MALSFTFTFTLHESRTWHSAEEVPLAKGNKTIPLVFAHEDTARCGIVDGDLSQKRSLDCEDAASRRDDPQLSSGDNYLEGKLL